MNSGTKLTKGAVVFVVLTPVAAAFLSFLRQPAAGGITDGFYCILLGKGCKALTDDPWKMSLQGN